MAVTLGADLLGRYRRFTLHNSPYVAHEAGCAVDLYPAAGAPSPVAGEVLDVRTVAAPPQPYADADDHRVHVAVDRAASPVSWDDPGRREGEQGRAGDAPPADGPAGDPDGLVARVLHVDPSVAPGDEVAVGDPLGRPVRSGFFAPWVGPHLHVGFRAPGADPYRASGSLPLAAGVDVEALPWDGTGTVVERGDTYVVLDAPAHPAPGERFVGVAALVGDEGTRARAGTPVALDGGLPHYAGGGLFGARGTAGGGDGTLPDGPVSLLDGRVGVVDGGRVAWDDVQVVLDGEPATGLSLFAARDGRFGAKVVGPDRLPEPGETVAVSVRDRPAGSRPRP